MGLFQGWGPGLGQGLLGPNDTDNDDDNDDNDDDDDDDDDNDDDNDIPGRHNERESFKGDHENPLSFSFSLVAHTETGTQRAVLSRTI